jgi:signal transduction histidine kinase
MLTNSDAGDPERVVDALHRMDAIVDDVLTLVREGHDVNDTEPVDLAALARDAWEYVDTQQASLVVDSDQVVLADPVRLQRAFENLFRNSLEHAGSDVTVTVDALDDDDSLLSGRVGFSVEDDGPGIPEGRRGDVFEAGHTTDKEGTGLGLSIVESIAKAHGWTVEVTESESGGARFEFTGVVLLEEDALEQPA